MVVYGQEQSLQVGQFDVLPETINLPSHMSGNYKKLQGSLRYLGFLLYTAYPFPLYPFPLSSYFAHEN